jgi:hypothetical protein
VGGCVVLRRCAWCGLILGRSEPLDEGGVTHGICLPCSDHLLEEFRQSSPPLAGPGPGAGGSDSPVRLAQPPRGGDLLR